MEASNRKSCAFIISALILTAMIAFVFAGAIDKPNGQADARIQGGAVGIVVQGPKTAYPNGNYADLIATEETLQYNASVPASPYSLDEMNFTWEIETELDTIVFSEGPNLKYRYYEVGNYTINVSVLLPDNSTGWKLIDLSVTLDYDEDGIADSWERHWFNSTGAVSPTTDHDGDGWTDLEEYENQTNPTTYTYKAGFLDQYWWLIVLIVVILMGAVLYLAVLRPKMASKRKQDEQKKIAAAVEIEKTLLSLDELEEKGKK